MQHLNDKPSQLLLDNFPQLKSILVKAESNHPVEVLDLACGFGRNGLFLVKNNIPVVFADNNLAALESIGKKLENHSATASSANSRCWHTDLESREGTPLREKQFDAVLVFNYLHRPLMDTIRQAIRPGGIIMYETFTVGQAEIGRPKNPDYLLRAGELEEYFRDWQVFYSFEGFKAAPKKAIASIVARRP